MDYRDEVYSQSRPEAEVPCPPAEFRRRLDSLRGRMKVAGIECSISWRRRVCTTLAAINVNGFRRNRRDNCPPAQPSRSITDYDRFMLFDSEREAILGASSQPPKIRGSFLAIPCGMAGGSVRSHFLRPQRISARR